MRRLLTTLFLLLVPAIAVAATSIDLPVTITHAGAGDTILPVPATGFHWVPTFGDEFNTTFNSSVWDVDHWCGGCSTPNATDVVSNGILTMTIQTSVPDTRNIIDTWTTSGGLGNRAFAQRYGYFVYDVKLPTCSSGEWDLESFGRDTWTGGAYGELAAASLKNACNYSSVSPYEIDNNRAIHWYETINAWVDLTQAFHQFGILWTADGSPHGSVVMYLDGQAVTSSHQLVSPSFDNGLYFDIYWSPEQAGNVLGGQGVAAPGSTMQFDWIRAYQLAPN